jgi:hypothetical protein
MTAKKPTTWEKLPPWAKGTIFAVFGTSGVGGLTQLPISINAKESFKSVKEEYPNALIESRPFLSHLYRVTTEDGKVVIVTTKMIDGSVDYKWE